MNYQYFIEVVPTDIQAVSGFTRSTYQYSVKDQERPIDHDTGSHGSPGIYFKYDVSALKVTRSPQVHSNCRVKVHLICRTILLLLTGV